MYIFLAEGSKVLIIDSVEYHFKLIGKRIKKTPEFKYESQEI